NRETIWQRFARPLPALTDQVPLGIYLLQTQNTPLSSPLQPITTFWESLDELKQQSAAELERLLTEVLDLCSHRMHAWLPSLPTKRLEEMRSAQPNGVHLGAYAWVENLKPQPVGGSVSLEDGRTVQLQSGNGGFVHAPSMAHAAAAAILRNAYLT